MKSSRKVIAVILLGLMWTAGLAAPACGCSGIPAWVDTLCRLVGGTI